MALFPSDLHRAFFTSPMERYLAQAFDDSLRDLGRIRSVAPYWLEQPMLQECNIGNSVGKVVNDAEKFVVSIDVTQFRPEELSVNVKDKDLVIEGHHEERRDHAGRIERHFVRKYAIPEDVNPESIESHLSDTGVLSVCAKRKALEQPKSRSIPIQAASRANQSAADKKQENVEQK